MIGLPGGGGPLFQGAPLRLALPPAGGFGSLFGMAAGGQPVQNIPIPQMQPQSGNDPFVDRAIAAAPPAWPGASPQPPLGGDNSDVASGGGLGRSALGESIARHAAATYGISPGLANAIATHPNPGSFINPGALRRALQKIIAQGPQDNMVAFPHSRPRLHLPPRTPGVLY